MESATLRLITRALLPALLLLSLAGSVQGDWWQKGRELLDNMEGIFHYLAPEEAAMRENPDKRTTELLRQVFGAKYAIIPTCPWFL